MDGPVFQMCVDTLIDLFSKIVRSALRLEVGEWIGVLAI